MLHVGTGTRARGPFGCSAAYGDGAASLKTRLSSMRELMPSFENTLRRWY